jgi:hypothetical protein
VSDINGFIDKDVEKMITRMDGDYWWQLLNH